jgi:DNA-binding CsgD family transcriptional regulator
LRGLTAELRDLLGSVLSTGILPALQRPQHVALLSIAAALAASEGRPTTARSLAQQALTLQTGPGPVPLGSPTQAIAELDLADQPPTQAKFAIANRLWSESEELLAKQYLMSGYICGVLAYVANPSRQRAEILAATASQIPAPLIRQFELLVQALDDGTPDALVDAANQLADSGHVWAATIAYTAGLAALRAAGNSAQAAIVHNDAKRRVDGWGPDAAAGLRSAADGAELTAREDEIARLAATGLSNQEIARRLLISVRTVENHLHRVFRKLGVDNRAGMSRALAG